MRSAIKTLILTSIFYNLSASLIGPLWATYVGTVGGGIQGATSAWAVYSFFVGFLILVFGRLGDRLNKKVMFVYGQFMNFIGTTGFLFVSNLFQLYVVQGILGISAAILSPSLNSLYGRNVQRGKESSQWSYLSGSVNIIFAVATFLTGAIVAVYGFQTLFLIMSANALIALLVSLAFVKTKLKGEIDFLEGKRVKK